MRIWLDKKAKEAEAEFAQLAADIDRKRAEIEKMTTRQHELRGVFATLRETANEYEAMLLDRPRDGTSFDPHGAPPELGPPPNEKADA